MDQKEAKCYVCENHEFQDITRICHMYIYLQAITQIISPMSNKSAKACQQLATKSRKKYAEVVIEKCSLK